jgi:hypothetical protein
LRPAARAQEIISAVVAVACTRAVSPLDSHMARLIIRVTGNIWGLPASSRSAREHVYRNAAGETASASSKPSRNSVEHGSAVNATEAFTRSTTCTTSAPGALRKPIILAHVEDVEYNIILQSAQRALWPSSTEKASLHSFAEVDGKVMMNLWIPQHITDSVMYSADELPVVSPRESPHTAPSKRPIAEMSQTRIDL